MSISIVCPNCHTPYTVPEALAGKTVTCKKCNALVEVPGGAAGYRGPVGGLSESSPYQRIVGRPVPLIVDIVGLHTRWGNEVGARDIFLLIWSFRYIVLLGAIIVLWVSNAGTPSSAEGASPLFLAGALVLLFIGWAQISMIARSLTDAISGRASGSILPHILSSLVLVVTEPRKALPALRTFFLGLLALTASLSLASVSGNMSNMLPISSFSSLSKPEREKPKPSAPPEQPTNPEQAVVPVPTPQPATGPTQPPPPPPEEKPLPPPDETTPIPPPP